MLLKKNSLRSKNKSKGFTLIELIAVLAIISILAATFLPKFSGYITESKKVGILNEAKQIVTAFESIGFKYSLNEDSTVATVISKATGLIDSGDITKLDNDTTVEECKQILDTENYDFTIVDNKLGTINKLQ